VRWHIDLVKIPAAKSILTSYPYIPVRPRLPSSGQPCWFLSTLATQLAFHIAANAAQTILTGPSPANQNLRAASQTTYPQLCRIPELCVGRPSLTAIKLPPQRSSTTAPPTSRGQRSTLMLRMLPKAMSVDQLSVPAGRKCRRETRSVLCQSRYHFHADQFIGHSTKD
jgi:hypothetical protein